MGTTLLVLAAGMGSRYGGLKQLESLGPEGKTLLDYSIDDAICAGFDSIVFVIRESFAEDFEQKISTHYRSHIDIQYAFQALDDLPNKRRCPAERCKPWGTAQALWSARKQINQSFAVINADDFYGRTAFEEMQSFCHSIPEDTHNALRAGLASYRLVNTLSENGSVNRGVCTLEANLELKMIEEYTEIERQASGYIEGTSPQGERKRLADDTAVSMNFWAFSPNIFGAIEAYFEQFLEQNSGDLKAECYLPNAIDSLIQSDRLICQTFITDSQWLGITYPEDSLLVRQRLRSITEKAGYFQAKN